MLELHNFFQYLSVKPDGRSGAKCIRLLRLIISIDLSIILFYQSIFVNSMNGSNYIYNCNFRIVFTPYIFFIRFKMYRESTILIFITYFSLIYFMHLKEQIIGHQLQLYNFGSWVENFDPLESKFDFFVGKLFKDAILNPEEICNVTIQL